MLRDFVFSKLGEQNLSLRDIAQKTGIQPSHLSEVVNGKRNPSAKLLNKLADNLGIPRIELYNAAGLVNLEDDEQFITQLREVLSKEPQFRKLLEMLLRFQEHERKRTVRYLLAISQDVEDEDEALASARIDTDGKVILEEGKLRFGENGKVLNPEDIEGSI
jgi:transcriptional regulator with XRE-family HTH domain